MMALKKTGENRFCRLCGIFSELPENVTDYADRLYRLLPARERAEEPLMKERLKVCEGCEKCNSGTCLACGCYTIIRVMKTDTRCPDKKW